MLFLKNQSLIVDLINELLRRQANFYTVTIGETEAKRYGPDFDMLTSLNILERGSASNERACQSCHNEILDAVIVSPIKAYTLCTQNEMSGRDYFHPQELRRWIFSLPTLLSLFQKAVGVDVSEPVETISSLLWDLGSADINNGTYRLFFVPTVSNPPDEKMSSFVSQFSQSVVLTSASYFSLGATPVVPLSELLYSLNEEGFILKSEAVDHYFPLNTGVPNEDALELDKDIVLQDNQLMFGRTSGGTFKKVVSIRPLSARIIKRLAQIRKYNEYAMTLDELAKALGSKKGSISNHIKQIVTACSENSSSQILHKYSYTKWGINPRLSSCR